MATNCKVTCGRDGEVVVNAGRILLDPDEERYRFSCPGGCGRMIEKPMDAHIFGLLRAAGAPTIDDLCQSFSALLEDDRQLARFAAP